MRAITCLTACACRCRSGILPRGEYPAPLFYGLRPQLPASIPEPAFAHSCKFLSASTRCCPPPPAVACLYPEACLYPPEFAVQRHSVSGCAAPVNVPCGACGDICPVICLRPGICKNGANPCPVPRYFAPMDLCVIDDMSITGAAAPENGPHGRRDSPGRFHPPLPPSAPAVTGPASLAWRPIREWFGAAPRRSNALHRCG